MFKLHGIYAPIATPFADRKIAYDKLEKNLKFWAGIRSNRDRGHGLLTVSSFCFRLR